MGSRKRELHAMLSHWLAQKKTTEREHEEADEEFKKWFRRARLALDQGEADLARSAKTAADEAHTRRHRAAARLAQIEDEVQRVRELAAQPDTELFEEARRRAEHAIAEFRKLGVDGRFAALDDAARAADEAGGAAARPSIDEEAEALLDMPLDDAPPADEGDEGDPALGRLRDRMTE